jgi:methylated-DNA-[protein]-cysteine S-methyltransferase
MAEMKKPARFLEEITRCSWRREAEAAASRFVRTASERDVDVTYAVVPSPFGPLLVAGTSRGLVRLGYPHEKIDRVLQEIAARVSPRILEAPDRLDAVRREIDEYFEGRRRHFDLPIDWALTHAFGREVLRATARIPFGEVATYREVAERAGRPRAIRAAGNALASNPIPIVVPCHRVLRSDGTLGGYTGGLDRKRYLLRLEGGLERVAPGGR